MSHIYLYNMYMVMGKLDNLLLLKPFHLIFPCLMDFRTRYMVSPFLFIRWRGWGRFHVRNCVLFGSITVNFVTYVNWKTWFKVTIVSIRTCWQFELWSFFTHFYSYTLFPVLHGLHCFTAVPSQQCKNSMPAIKTNPCLYFKFFITQSYLQLLMA